MEDNNDNIDESLKINIDDELENDRNVNKDDINDDVDYNNKTLKEYEALKQKLSSDKEATKNEEIEKLIDEITDFATMTKNIEVEKVSVDNANGDRYLVILLEFKNISSERPSFLNFISSNNIEDSLEERSTLDEWSDKIRNKSFMVIKREHLEKTMQEILSTLFTVDLDKSYIITDKLTIAKAMGITSEYVYNNITSGGYGHNFITYFSGLNSVRSIVYDIEKFRDIQEKIIRRMNESEQCNSSFLSELMNRSMYMKKEKIYPTMR